MTFTTTTVQVVRVLRNCITHYFLLPKNAVWQPVDSGQFKSKECFGYSLFPKHIETTHIRYRSLGRYIHSIIFSYAWIIWWWHLNSKNLRASSWTCITHRGMEWIPATFLGEHPVVWKVGFCCSSLSQKTSGILTQIPFVTFESGGSQLCSRTVNNQWNIFPTSSSSFKVHTLGRRI